MTVAPELRGRVTAAIVPVRRILDRPPTPLALWVPAGLAFSIGLASARLTGRNGVAAGIVAAGVILALRLPVAAVAVAWGALLPVEVVRGVPSWALDAMRYGVAAVLVLRVPAEQAWRARRWLQWTAALVVLAVVRLVAAGARGDGAGARIGAIVLVATVVGALVASRDPLRVPIARGFMIGSSISAIAVLLQVGGITTLGLELAGNQRYPGLSTQTSAVTWHLALGIIIAGCALLRRPADLAPPWLAGSCLVLTALALVTCGAQGGFLGLAAAAVGARHLFGTLTPRQRRIAGLGLGAAVLLVVAAAASADVVGLVPDKGFVNESTRVQLVVDAVREIAAHPLTGQDASTFRARYEVLPHAVVLETGVAAGVVGVAAALVATWLLVRVVFHRPTTDGASLGVALAAALLANSLVEAGTFIGLGRVSLLLVTVGLVLLPGPDGSAATGELGARRRAP